ncbi:2-oxo-4-hydroxy-4-carboxy-5-ureidoimidazoline decarboxylase [Rahnella sp. SL6]|uniref:2-oxo-4-hydroxy-4-carboxy-5-ureidoimidazoline decarboxylase n=1 Tax=Rahnella perminowiae TaxID=2816244 RepID=UPI001C2575BE|nr:2-oxo-4-hydroxy-4-carboxy-5-ureidoimidazoline decarboxylase [Rahnella perminowiae]MBU9812598.1 2-oxo-4-hydroxy-4-carboxy-5-ureidoimidazoline decarboxylase [Rahnella perminowiae]MBU9826081.1 2-oxo-4-hydroxy-4-carboxy-5-ureidoimidazoline decarboxylase [Rahnella perminowiae]
MTPEAFNALSETEAVSLLRPLVSIPAWAKTVSEARPYSSVEDVLRCAEAACDNWTQEDIARALSAHPRIGERASGTGKEAQLSRGEQATLNISQQAVTDALHDGNLRYEQRFGRVFLIRAKGRSAEQILDNLQRRLQNLPDDEDRETAQQLKEITLLRLKEIFQS